MRPVNWGIIGTSWIARTRVIPAMQASPDVTIGAIASRSIDKAQAAADAMGIPAAYGAYQALLDDPAIEAVYLPLPNTLHVEWSIRALEAGKHVLCEKPIALSAAEASRLAETAHRTGLHCEEAFPFVNHPQWHFMRRLIARGEIGPVRSVSVSLAYRNLDPANLRNIPAEGGGALYDLGSYAINACRIAFAAEPIEAIGAFDTDPSFGTDRLTSAILRFPEGQAVIAVATQIGPTTGGSHQHFGAIGEGGWLRADFPFSHSTPSACHVAIGDPASLGGLPARIETFPAVDQYRLQMERFSRLVRGEPADAWPMAHAVGNMRVIDALFRSRASRGGEAI